MTATNPLPGEGLPGSDLIPVATASAAPTPGASPRRGAFGPGLRAMHAITSQPVAAHGWRWGSQADAARAMGTSKYNVHRAIKIGTFSDLVLRRLGVKP